MVLFPPGDEVFQFVQLGTSYRSLHVGHLEVVPNVAVHVLVVITGREAAELLGKPFPAGVVLPAGTVAVTSPIAKRACNSCQIIIVSHHTPTLAHGDMVSRVE